MAESEGGARRSGAAARSGSAGARSGRAGGGSSRTGRGSEAGGRAAASRRPPAAAKGDGQAELAAALAQGQLPRVVVLYGSERHRLLRAAALVRQSLLSPEEEPWNVTTLSVPPASTSEVLAALHTPPPVGERRLVVVQGFDRWPAAELAALAERLATLPAWSHLLLVGEELENRTSVLTPLLQQDQVLAVQFSPLAGAELERWLQAEAARRGLRLSAEARAALLSRAGEDVGLLASELDKLRARLGPEAEVTPELVAEVAAEGTTRLAENAIFQLLDQISLRKPAEALRLLQELLGSGEPPLRILSLIARQVRLLYGAAALAGRPPEEVATTLGVPPFAARKLLSQARQFTWSELEAGMEQVVLADRRLKSGVDAGHALPALVVSLTIGPTVQGEQPARR